MHGYGYNPEMAKKVLNAINKYNLEYQTIGFVHFQNKVVIPLSKIWYAPTARDYIKKTCEWISSYILGQVVVGCLKDNYMVNRAALNWAQSVGESYTSVPFEQINLSSNLDYTVVKLSREDGFRGVAGNLDDVSKLLSAFEQLLSELDENAKKFKDNIAGNVAFLGAEQLQELINHIDRGTKTLHDNFAWIYEEIKFCLNDTYETYQSTAQANAQRFAAGN